MTSHDANLLYATALPSGQHRLHLDLFPALTGSHGCLHDTFVAHFSLEETDEIKGLVTLRATSTVDAFLQFFGSTWTETLARWDTLAWMSDYRKEHGPDAYVQLADWQLFYDLLNDRIVPESVELAFIEHY